MDDIDHQMIRFSSLGRQSFKDLNKYAQTALADETVVDRPGRAVLGRNIALPQPIADDEDDAADDPASDFWSKEIRASHASRFSSLAPNAESSFAKISGEKGVCLLAL